MSIQEKLKTWGSKFNNWLKRGDLVVTIVIVLGILAVLNFLTYQVFTRIDMTQNNIYSISQVSKEAVSDLDDVVRVKIYFSEDLPNEHAGLEEEVKDILNEYVSYSDGQVKVESIDPEELENTRRTLAGMGIPQMRFNVMKKGSYQVSTGYMGMAVQYGNEVESIPVIKNTQNLEYKITSAVKKVTQEKVPQVALVTSHGSLASGDQFKTAKEKLQEVYEVKEVNLAEEDIPNPIGTLVLPGPTQKLEQAELEKLDSFVMKGGSLLVLADGVRIESGLAATPNEIGINNLINNYGLQLNNDLVLDKSSARVNFSSGMMRFHSQYPPWVKVQKKNFNGDNVAVSDLESLTLPWVSSVDITGTSSDNYTVLARSTDGAWTQQNNFRLRPNAEFLPQNTQQYKLAVMTAGEINSAYSDQSTAEGRVILVGDSDFIKERYVGNNQNNLTFFQNLVDVVSLDSDLIKIRSKQVTDRPLRDISGTAKTALKYLNIFGLPVVVVIFGLVRYYIRKKRS